MAIFSTPWDLSPCSRFVLAVSFSQQKTAPKRSFSPSMGTCTSCNCDLDSQFEIDGRFNPALNGFETTCTNPVHEFALRCSASGGQATKKTNKRSLGSFPPILKAVAPTVGRSQQCSSRGGQYPGPESDIEEDEQCPFRGGALNDYVPNLDCDDKTIQQLLLRGGGALDTYFKSDSDDVDDAQWTAVGKSRRKPAQKTEEHLKKVLNEVNSNTAKAKDIRLISPTRGAPPLKKDGTKAAWQQMHEARREEVRAKKEAVIARRKNIIVEGNDDKVTFIEGPAPLPWHAKAAVAVEKVKKVQAVLEASKPNHALKLTPASVIHKPIATTSKQTVSLEIDLANLTRQSKKIQIANKLINTLNIQEALAKEIILKGATQTCGTYTKGGIHVFIDASNIQLGFQDALKKNAGLTSDDYVNNTPSIIFECFCFILERGRPVNKREIVGSSINGVRPEYFGDAEACGYRATAPEKVRKIRTNRKWIDGKKVEVEREAFFEQLVDEYIQRLMSDSILDAVIHNQEPGTIVLATGDANGAEYDDNGFLQYVERALNLGWKVEVVAWKPSMSNNWMNLKEKSKYRDNLTIITLDEFREDLTRDQTAADKAAACWWRKET